MSEPDDELKERLINVLVFLLMAGCILTFFAVAWKLIFL